MGLIRVSTTAGILAILLCAIVVSQSSVAAGGSQESLVEALDRQDAWLSTSPKHGGRWSKFLRTAELRRELRKAEKARDMSAIAEVIGRYESGHQGLELPVFRRTARALRKWAARQGLTRHRPWIAALRNRQVGNDQANLFRVRTAQRNLRRAVGELDAFLTQGKADNAQRWKDFLQWEDLQSQLDVENPDWQVLEAVGWKFFDGHPGLEYPQFVNVRDAIRTYAEIGKAPSQSVQARITALANSLERQMQDPSTRNASDVALMLHWLEELDCVPELGHQIRAVNLHPNVSLQISESILADRFNRPVDETRPVDEMILKTRAIGTAHTTGQVTTDVVRNRDFAQINIVFNGKSVTNSVGRQKPVTICSTSVTALCAQKPIFLDGDGIRLSPTRAKGKTKTTIHSIKPDRSGLGSKLIEQIAWRRSKQQKPKTEAIAAGRAARRLEKQMDETSAELKDEGGVSLSDVLDGSAKRRGLVPESIQASSTDDAVIIEAVQAGSTQFAAAAAPPASGFETGVQLQVHESAINNTAEKAISALTLTDERIATLVKELTGSVPPGLQITEDDEPWSITFDWRQPVTVEFDEDVVRIAVRGRSFTRGERVLNKVMEMAAQYTVETSDKGILLTRQGEVEVTFPGSARTGTLDLIFKTLMQRKFSELFKPTIEGDGIELPGELAEKGAIRLRHVTANDGWLSLGWD